jgi:hypothetical protein
MEFRFDQRLQDIFSEGIKIGAFRYDGDLALLAASTTAMLQQWYLKRWKFQHLHTGIEQYAEFILTTLLNSLDCKR